MKRFLRPWFTLVIVTLLLPLTQAAPSCADTDCAQETTADPGPIADHSSTFTPSRSAKRRHRAVARGLLSSLTSSRTGKSRLPAELFTSPKHGDVLGSGLALDFGNGKGSAIFDGAKGSGIFDGLDLGWGSSHSSGSNSGGEGESGGSTIPGADNAKDKAAYLAAHNSYRKSRGAKSLAWSDDLAASAQKWANRCVFEHSRGAVGDYGENLVYSSAPNFSIEYGIKMWTDEEKDYNPLSPMYSHFTQVVWKDTKKLGCAMKVCDGSTDSRMKNAKFIVCEYSPPGNVIGKFAENVQRL
ncbi:hypothetical protein HGRIS_014077 [Hohenbuehelia grisea]|uniref:SCP domain-containing protein n=1 Tax=Hohenbuehelia grisea TaxID=104357 RepID=A0ABR3JUC1_9AGAR